MKRNNIVISIVIILLIIFISLHAILLYKIIPILNNFQKLTDELNNDYEIIYNQIINFFNKTNTMIDNTQKSIHNMEKTISKLNQTISNLQKLNF